MSIDKKTHAVEPGKVKKDDILSFTFYTTVQHVQIGGDRIVVRDDDYDREMTIQGAELVAGAFSADQYAEEVKVSKTEAAELLVSSQNRPFTVCFDKADGTERILRGRLIRPEPLLGRSMVVDLGQKNGAHRERLVDHRTIKFLVVEGVKYIVK